MNWYLEALRKYAVFNGRAQRAEYWYFYLFNILISIGLALIVGLTGRVAYTDQSVLANLYTLAVLLPSIAVAVRRLHDTGRTGWWLFIAFIPLIGAIVLLVFTVQDSQPGENDYGPNPQGT